MMPVQISPLDIDVFSILYIRRNTQFGDIKNTSKFIITVKNGFRFYKIRTVICRIFVKLLKDIVQSL